MDNIITDQGTVNPINPSTDKATPKVTDWSRYQKVKFILGGLYTGTALDSAWEPVLLNDKVPLRAEWQKGEITPGTLADDRLRHKDRITGIGFRTGNLAVADIDCTDDALTEIIHGAMLETLGPGALYRRGSKGYAALYWNDTPIKKLSLSFSKDGVSHKIENLGQGQQMGGFGHVKANAKKNTPAFDYKWLDGKSPLDIAPYALPSVTPQGLQNFLDVAKAKLIEAGCTIGAEKKDAEPGKSASNGGLVSVAMLEKMLGCIDPGKDHNEGLPVVAALKHAEETQLIVDPDTFEPVETFSAREVAAAWSRGEYQPGQEPPANYAEGWAEARYDSLKGVAEGGTTLATLVSLARDGGYAGETRIDSWLDRLPPDDELRADSIMPTANPTTEKPAVSKLKVQIDNEIVESSKKFVSQIIPGWLTASGFTLMVGGKRVGKTTFAADMIGRIINDEEFYGRKTLKGWSVGYIAAEDVPGTKARLAANAMHNGGSFVKVGNHHRFAWHEERIDLRNWAEVQAVADAFMTALGKRKDILMVIDTYGKCLPVDQSDETATKLASANVVKLAQYVQGAVLVLGQPSREGKRAISGSGVLENDAEGLIWLQINDAKNAGTTSNRSGVLAEAIDMKNCESGSRMEFQILSTNTVADPSVRDQEGNRVTAGYASVMRGWDAKGKEIKGCPDFKAYVHPKADLIEQVQDMDRWQGGQLEGEAREVFEDGVRAGRLIRSIHAAAKKAGADPDGYGVSQKALLEPWGINPTTVRDVSEPKGKTIKEHMAAGRILNHTEVIDGVRYMLKRRDAQGGHAGSGGRKSPELYIVAMEKIDLGE